VGIGFGHDKIATHSDFVMCEFHHEADPEDHDVKCYDRFWDGNEFYEDDTLMDGAFKMYDHKKHNKDGSIDLSITVAKFYKSKLGSHDYEIHDGMDLELIWLTGDIF
jgi:hypothetical protein